MSAAAPAPDRAADVVVIGAGCAGLSAAVRLADRGRKVIVVEQGPRLGGRATAFTDKATGERVDNGHHVLFGCYRETYAFLRLIGTDDLAPLQPRLQLPMVDRSGRVIELRCPDLPPPWHLVGGLLGWKALSLLDRIAALRVGRVIHEARRLGVDVVVGRIDPAETVTGWLDRLRQPKAVRDWLWHPLALAALNQSADVATAAPFVRVVAQLFGPSPDDAAIGMARVALDEMYAEPARRFLADRGGDVRLMTPARVSIDQRGHAVGVDTPAGPIAARHVISAVPWHAFERLWTAGLPSQVASVGRAATATGSSPIVTVNLWFDGPVMDRPFIGLVDSPIHWIFDKSAIVGRHMSHLAAVTSGADDQVSADNEEVSQLAVAEIRRVCPEAGRRRVIRSVVVREQRATFSLAPGAPPRPGPLTGLPGFVLAGDWTDTGLPATIEGAVLSGHRAADVVLADAGHDTPSPAGA